MSDTTREDIVMSDEARDAQEFTGRKVYATCKWCQKDRHPIDANGICEGCRAVGALLRRTQIV